MITTANESWEFFGTLRTREACDAGEIFDTAARALLAKFNITADQARDVLDARVGRHIADQIVDGESGTGLVERLLAHRGWARSIRRAIPDRKRGVTLAVRSGEIAVLRFALDHALSSTSEAHAADRAQLAALIERLEAAQR